MRKPGAEGPVAQGKYVATPNMLIGGWQVQEEGIDPEALPLGVIADCRTEGDARRVAEALNLVASLEALPVKAAAAVILGIVRPIVCPSCEGTGRTVALSQMNAQVGLQWAYFREPVLQCSLCRETWPICNEAHLMASQLAGLLQKGV